MKKTAFLLVSGCLLLVLALSGCGYTTRSMIASKYRTIYVQPFTNKVDITNEAYSANKYRIYRPLLESDVTKKVINKYLFDGNLKPVKEDRADVILKGELVDYRKDPLRYDQSDNVAEYRINIVVNISLWDRTDNSLIWEEKGFTGDYSFFTSGSQATSEDSAVNKALDDLARRIVERTVEQW